MPAVGMVVIGRNEGERLRRCLESLHPDRYPVVYIDSGSTDDSAAMARTLKVDVVNLDLSRPFTAARARNEGFERLIETHPNLEFVQFVDGDCAVDPNWLETALAAIAEDPKRAVVCGRQRERYPEHSVYNRLIDIEWNTPIGEARSCGGCALMRVSALVQVHGYNPAVIAAEDDEVCVRLRQQGWKIQRIDAEMTLHDAAMSRVPQWWNRAKRCGYAYALGYSMHGAPPERHFVRENRRILLYGFILPVIFFALAWPTWGISLLGFAIYPIQMLRIARKTRQQKGVPAGDARAYGISCMAAKVPEFLGLLKFQANRLFRRQARIIEYK